MLFYVFDLCTVTGVAKIMRVGRITLGSRNEAIHTTARTFPGRACAYNSSCTWLQRVVEKIVMSRDSSRVDAPSRQ